jgi:hypothetical protein
MVKTAEIHTHVRAGVVHLSTEGLSSRQISSRLGISQPSVIRILRKFNETGSTANLRRTGRPRVTTSRCDSVIRRFAVQNPFISSVEIRNNLPLPQPSRRTICRRLQIKFGLHAYQPARKPRLSKAQIKKRLQFCHQYKNWTVQQWQRVLWSDESTFQQFGQYPHHVRRPAAARYNIRYTVPTVKHAPSVMIWGCFAGKGIGSLHLIPPKTYVNADKYLQILQDKLQNSMEILDCTHFQQDGAPCHTAKKVTAWFLANNIPTIKFPPNSPDLNPIENLWRIMKDKVADSKPSSLPDLQQKISTYWSTGISEDLCMRLVSSMPNRISAVLAAKGMHSKY